MLKLAYQAGAFQALSLLSLEKLATMLPPPTAAAKAIGAKAGRTGVQAADTAVSGGLAAKETTPLMQHISAMGTPHAGESGTSRWFRSNLLSQADPTEMLARAQIPAAGQTGGATTRKVVTPESVAPTIPPPGR